jgi:hypothetical protein
MKAFNLISIAVVSLLGLVFVSAVVFAVSKLVMGNVHNGFVGIG